MERDVATATRLFSDARLEHYWDGESVLVEGYQQVLQLPEDAWDIFLLYGPNARWDGALPPPPDYWMHQLGSAEKPRLTGPFLDSEKLLQHVLSLLLTD